MEYDSLTDFYKFHSILYLSVGCGGFFSFTAFQMEK